MNFSPRHLRRYGKIAGLLWKYGRIDLKKGADAGPGTPADDPKSTRRKAPTPQELADDLEAMGPTFVKFGQVLAGRPDILPEPYITALSRLHDRVKPFPYPEVEEIIAAELGVRVSKAFARFETTPLAAASLGQVHRAELRDGRLVVVKVQRPNISRQISEDFETLAEIAAFLDAHTDQGRRYRFELLLEEFRTTIQHELNYELEARNLEVIGESLKEFDLITVPQPVPGLCSRSVLTMDYVLGTKITGLGPLAKLETDRTALVEQLFQAYLKQVLIVGLFHADPHPGNVLLTDDGRLALIDLGMVGHVPPHMREKLLKLLIAISEGKSEDAADLVVSLGEKRETFDAAEFRRRIRRLLAGDNVGELRQLKVGQSLIALSGDAARCDLFVPSELTLLGKTLLQLDGIGRVLDPRFDPNALVRRCAADLLLKHVMHDTTQGSVFGAVLDFKNFVGCLPSRLNRIMDAVAGAELEVKVKAVDAKVVLDGMQKIANRITVGLILAALIVGASLLMRVPTRFEIFGYPGLAILCFLGAAAGGIWLIVDILVRDPKILRKQLR